MDREFAEVATHFKRWKSTRHTIAERFRKLDEWLFLNASAVLIGDKTGELLSLDISEMDLDTHKIIAHLHARAKDWSFSCHILKTNRQGIKFIVYIKERLDAVIRDAPHCVMVEQLGYSAGLNSESFLGEIQKRWKDADDIPHEIGIALGYPLEDVFGYMGLLPLPCRGLCGWQVFGDMDEARRRSCGYQFARCRALAFMAV